MRKVISHFTLAIAVLIVTSVYIVQVDTHWQDRLFNEMIDGTAHKPYVTRCLLPIIVRNTARIIPQSTHEWIHETVNDLCPYWIPHYGELPDGLPLQDINYTYFILSCIVWFASFWIFATAMRMLVKLFYPERDAFLISTISLLFLILMMYSRPMVYDALTLPLFAMGFYLMARNKLSYLLIFTLASINRETSILLILAYAATSNVRGEPADRKKRMLLAQIIIWVVIRIIIYSAFKDNIGSGVEIHFSENMMLFAHSPLTVFLIVIPFCFLVFYGWKSKNTFIRKALLATLPFQVICLLFVAVLNEYRLWFELYPLFVLAAIHTVCERLLNGTQ